MLVMSLQKNLVNVVKKMEAKLHYLDIQLHI